MTAKRSLELLSAAQKKSDKLLFKYPLAGALRPLQDTQLKKKKNPLRTSVVSDKLCDDALALLGSSLLKHKGCDIVDFFPGVGLWSRKIHELLKPRQHRLIEPKAPFREFLQPLVDQPGSVYSLYNPTSNPPIPLALHETYGDLINDPDKLAGIQGHRPNNDLLVLATMSKDLTYRSKPHPNLAISLSSSPAEPFVHQFVREAVARIGLHSYGTVRLLLWTWDRDQFNLLPRNVSGRNSTSIALEELFDPRMIVGSWEPPVHTRASKLDVISAVKTTKTMKQLGLVLPEVRRSGLPQTAFNDLRTAERKINDGNMVTQTDLERLVEEQDNLETAYLSGDFARYKDLKKGSDKRTKVNTKEYTKMMHLQKQLDELAKVSKKDGHSAEHQLVSKVDNPQQNVTAMPFHTDNKRLNYDERSRTVVELVKLNDLERRIAQMESTQLVDGKKLQTEKISEQHAIILDMREQLDVLLLSGNLLQNAEADRIATALVELTEFERRQRLGKENEKLPLATLKQQMEELYCKIEKYIRTNETSKRISTIMTKCDNYEAFNTKPPLLIWDRRQFEPLQCDSNEFFPQYKLALVDFQPKELPDGQSPIHGNTFLRILKGYSTYSITAALDNISHGAADALLPHCPSIHDPLKGGRLHIEYLRVRMLTQEMWRELSEAWEAWPLRLSEERLVTQFSKSTVFTDFDNGER